MGHAQTHHSRGRLPLLGHLRQFGPVAVTSGLPRTTDIIRLALLVRFVPKGAFGLPSENPPGRDLKHCTVVVDTVPGHSYRSSEHVSGLVTDQYSRGCAPNRQCQRVYEYTPLAGRFSSSAYGGAEDSRINGVAFGGGTGDNPACFQSPIYRSGLPDGF
jgi:hypothetical protein